MSFVFYHDQIIWLSDVFFRDPFEVAMKFIFLKEFSRFMERFLSD